MSIERRKMDSADMQTAISFVKRMTKYMVFDENMEQTNWSRTRRVNNFFYRLIPRQKGIEYKKLSLGKVKALEAYGKEIDSSNLILYIHGGGFVTGSAFVSKSYISMLAKFSGYRVYAVEYALAPENPYPAGFNDCCEAFEELCKRHPNAKITLVGESAGGNYCVALGLKYKATGKISSIIAHSPTVDFSGKVDHDMNENKDFIVKKGCLEPLRRMYVGENDYTNPYISPMYGDFKGFPAIYITCDVNETLYADSKALYDACAAAGVEVQMVEAEGTYHAFAVTGTSAPETTEILEENVAFMKAHIS